MGSSYQTVLAVGEFAEIRETLDRMGIRALMEQVGPRRWAVAPEEGEGDYAETDDIAEQLSLLPDGLVAAFQVHDSDALTAQLFRDGRLFHSYLSDRSHVIEWYDDDDNEILVDLLGEPWTGEGYPPREAVGAEAEVFAALGVGDIDLDALRRGLSEPQLLSERQHGDILRALNLHPCPLTSAYRHQVSRNPESERPESGLPCGHDRHQR